MEANQTDFTEPFPPFTDAELMRISADLDRLRVQVPELVSCLYAKEFDSIQQMIKILLP